MTFLFITIKWLAVCLFWTVAGYATFRLAMWITGGWAIWFSPVWVIAWICNCAMALIGVIESEGP